jgi:hypothetical protein|tara:strand:+ start:11363 stop:11818 length:456 start_codon:yes stop_codon:yes gene_type:complete
MNNDKIAENLGMRPLSEVREEAIEHLPIEIEDDPVPSTDVQVLDIDTENLEDLNKVRANIQGVMDIGQDAVKEMLEIAKQSEQPRAFEVVSTLMKTLLDANKDFADISSKKKFALEEVNGPKEAAQTNVTNNNLIVSTADLLKMLKENDNG